MAATAEQRQKFLTAFQQYSKMLVSTLNDADELYQRWIDLGLAQEQFTQDDFTASGSHIDNTLLANGMNTYSELRTLANAGHRANLNKVIL